MPHISTSPPKCVLTQLEDEGKTESWTLHVLFLMSHSLSWNMTTSYIIISDHWAVICTYSQAASLLVYKNCSLVYSAPKTSPGIETDVYAVAMARAVLKRGSSRGVARRTSPFSESHQTEQLVSTAEMPSSQQGGLHHLGSRSRSAKFSQNLFLHKLPFNPQNIEGVIDSFWTRWKVNIPTNTVELQHFRFCVLLLA